MAPLIAAEVSDHGAYEPTLIDRLLVWLGRWL